MGTDAIGEGWVETEPPQTYQVTLAGEQVALIVWCLMEQGVHVSVSERIEWSRLAVALNDLLTPEEVSDGAEPEPG